MTCCEENYFDFLIKPLPWLFYCFHTVAIGTRQKNVTGEYQHHDRRMQNISFAKLGYFQTRKIITYTSERLAPSLYTVLLWLLW